MELSCRTKSVLKLIGWSLAGGLLMPFVTCPPCRSSIDYYLNVAIFTSVTWIAMWLGNEVINDVLNRKFPWTGKPLIRLTSGVVAMLLYTIPVMYLLVKIFEMFLGISLGSMSAILYSCVIITIIITLVLTSRSFLVNWKQSAIDAEMLKRESIAARYENLKSQVNPHFLFNSLNALTNLVYEDQEKAVKFIKQLSEVYRYVLDTREQEIVSLKEELKFLTSYIYLQQIRFGDKLKIHLDLNGVESQIAPLVLQMLVENAIKHNVVSQEDPLHINIYQADGYIFVENNLQRKNQVQDSSGLGLENIRSRYEFLTHKDIGIMEADNKFIVKIPLIR